MNASQTILLDLTRELKVTRTVLERIPEAEFGWRVHEKSMSLGRLAMHVATLPEWLFGTLANDEMDVATSPPLPTEASSSAALLQTFDDAAARATDALAKFSPEDWNKPWTMRNGDTVIHSNTKALIARVWCVNHLIHHRAQLCVYLRVLNQPVPAVYFNSADEPGWRFE